MDDKIKKNIVVDMVADCIRYYKNQGNPIKTIKLNNSRFSMLKNYIEAKRPDVQVDNKIIFADIEILLDKFAIQTMTWEFITPTIE
jgi:hypothetical protein